MSEITQRIQRSIIAANPSAISDCVDEIIGADEGNARSLVGKTTKSSYRRLHEMIAGALDYCITSKETDGIGELLIKLTRAKVMISYQRSRDQISPGVELALSTIVDSVKTAINRGGVNRVTICRHARLLLDAIAVLVYRFGKKVSS